MADGYKQTSPTSEKSSGSQLKSGETVPDSDISIGFASDASVTLRESIAEGSPTSSPTSSKRKINNSCVNVRPVKDAVTEDSDGTPTFRRKAVARRFVNSTSTPNSKGVLDTSIASFIQDSSSLSVIEGSGRGSILEEVNSILDCAADLTRRGSGFALENRLQELQADFDNSLADNTEEWPELDYDESASWYDRVNNLEEEEYAKAEELFLHKRTEIDNYQGLNLKEQFGIQSLPLVDCLRSDYLSVAGAGDRSESTTDPVVNSFSTETLVPEVNMATNVVQIDPLQFKALFKECFNEAITTDDTTRVISDALGHELRNLDEKILDVRNRVDVIESHVNGSKVNVDRLPEMLDRLEQTDKSVLNVASKVAQLNEGGRLDRLGGKLQYMENEVMNLTGNVVPKLNVDVGTLNMNYQSLETRHNSVNAQVYADVSGLRGEIANLRQEMEELRGRNLNAEGVANAPNAASAASVSVLSQKINQLEQTNNLKYLLFDGIPEVAQEDTPKHLVSTLAGLLTPELKLCDIDNAFRIGRSRDGRPKTILVQFVYASIAMRIYRSRMQLARARSNYFISEYLTKEVENICYKARQYRAAGRPIRKIWTYKGLCNVTAVDNAKGTVINSLEELDRFVANAGVQPQVPPPAPMDA